jgi:hypothetical protein
MVKAKHKAKWPLQVHSTKHKRRPDWPPEVSYKHDPDILKDTGICKPDDATVGHVAILKNATLRHYKNKLTTLKNAAPGHLEEKIQYIEGGPTSNVC